MRPPAIKTMHPTASVTFRPNLAGGEGRERNIDKEAVVGGRDSQTAVALAAFRNAHLSLRVVVKSEPRKQPMMKAVTTKPFPKSSYLQTYNAWVSKARQV